MSLNRALGILAAILVLSALIWWGVTHLEVAEVKQAVPPSPEVKSDAFYALQRILSPEVKVSRYSSPETIDLKHASLVIINAGNLGSLDKAHLTRWLDGGGDLLVYFTESSDVPAAKWWEGRGPFADLAPRFEPPTQTAAAHSGAGAEEGKKSSQSAPIEPVRSKGGILVDPRVSFPQAVSDTRTSLIQVGQKSHIVARTWGSGALVVCGLPFFLENENLKQSENLDFADWFLGGLVVHSGGAAWIPKTLAGRTAGQRIEAWPILVAFLAVFLLLVWMKSPRLGPIIPEAPVETRSLRHRFRAEGRFLWRYGAGGQLKRSLESRRPIDDGVSGAMQKGRKLFSGLRARLERPSRSQFQKSVAECARENVRPRGGT